MKPVNIAPAKLTDDHGIALPDDHQITLTVGKLRYALDRYAKFVVTAALLQKRDAVIEWLAAADKPAE